MTPRGLTCAPLLRPPLLVRSPAAHAVEKTTTRSWSVLTPVTVAAVRGGGRPRRCSDPHTCFQLCRCFAQVQDPEGRSQKPSRELWFTSSAPRAVESSHPPPDDRTLQLGRTVRILHQRLPTLLKEPLPADILSPHISLHLFPSTHPHLPTVSGRIAYVAALWTAPVAWGRVPLVGNVTLTILSERMVRNGGTRPTAPAGRTAPRDEKLIVKWTTCSKAKPVGVGGSGRSADEKRVSPAAPAVTPESRSPTAANSTKPQDPELDEEFCGMFVFEFDDRGRIVKHVIEHTEEGGHWDRTARVVSVTDWLLGRFNGKAKDEEPALAWCEERPRPDDPMSGIGQRDSR